MSDFFETNLVKGGGFHVVNTTTKTSREEVFLKLAPPFFVECLGSHPFLKLWKHAVDTLGARSVVIEPYVSTDWNSEYSSIYSRAFKNIPQRAQRLHFFSRDVGYGDLYRMNEMLKKSYLGYTIVRPLGAFRVGDTVLVSPSRTINGINKELVHCQQEFKVSLIGNDLKVRGMPFMQQDTTAGVCAEADLWMVARYLNKKGDTRRYRPAEITLLANKTFTTGPGREGLFDHQMMNVLRDMGLNPVVFYPPDKKEAMDFTYMSVESELPIIVGIPEHVFVVIGHDYSDSFVFQKDGDINRMSDVVNTLIVHDDAAGPYIELEVTAETKIMENGREKELLKLGGEFVNFFMVALPHRVHMYWEDALWHADIWLQEINDVVKDLFELSFDAWGEDELNDLIIRAYLRLSSKFKSDLLNVSTGDLRAEEVIASYKYIEMPKYVWVVELARRSDFESTSIYDRRICGEIVLDSTGNRHSPEETLIAFHLDGVFFVPWKDDKPATLLVADESPYTPLQRSTCQTG
ncbi:hypothetical protein KAR91_40230 [Candidatus Pacearchaeota archaeon]|nr:hypothetical protein [Candidatus Pacearchaeota archaeon]